MKDAGALGAEIFVHRCELTQQVYLTKCKLSRLQRKIYRSFQCLHSLGTIRQLFQFRCIPENDRLGPLILIRRFYWSFCQAKFHRSSPSLRSLGTRCNALPRRRTQGTVHSGLTFPLCSIYRKCSSHHPGVVAYVWCHQPSVPEWPRCRLRLMLDLPLLWPRRVP